MEQTPAHDRPNPDLLDAMPKAATVVEVGCSRGALALAYKQRNPYTRYIGIEIDADYATTAQQHCDEVRFGNIEDLIQSDAIKDLSQADCWVFGDTLEHLQDPWQVLRSTHELLSPNGCVCACIPNMQHWSIQLRLNTGRIEYADSGLLDRTHLRWFTRVTINQLFTNSGFEIAYVKPRIFPNAHTEQALNIVGQVAKQIGHDPQQAIQDALPLQYVIKAFRKPASSATAEQP